jgi:hypothetical protein
LGGRRRRETTDRTSENDAPDGRTPTPVPQRNPQRRDPFSRLPTVPRTRAPPHPEPKSIATRARRNTH